MPTDNNLLDRIEAFCRKKDLSLTGFGRKACRDPNLVAQLRAGRSPTLRTLKKIEIFMEGYRG